MKKLAVEEMKKVTGGATYYYTWYCDYCSMHGTESGKTKDIAKTKGEYKKALHHFNIHNV